MSVRNHDSTERDHDRATGPRQPECQTRAALPEAGDVVGLLRRMQQTAGNAAVNDLLRRHALREQAHARAAIARAQALSAPAGGAGDAAGPEIGPDGGPLSPEVAGQITARRGGGAPLDEGARRPLESAFGTSFGDVRVHTDDEADTLNRSVSATAFTTGSDIFFRSGTYQPHSPAGRHLLAHELTHVVQQRGTAGAAGAGPMMVGPAGDSAEQEAETTSAQVMRAFDGGRGEPPPDAPSDPPGAGTGAAGSGDSGATTGAIGRVIQRRTAPAGGTQSPQLKQVLTQLHQAGATVKKHDPVKGMVAKAQGAAPIPANDTLAKAQAKQAEAMHGTPPGTFDKAAFIRLIHQKIAALAPQSDNDLKNFKSSGKAGAMAGELKGGVQTHQEHAQGPIAGATNAPPPTNAVTPLTPGAPPQAAGAPALPHIDPNNAVPPPAPDPGPSMVQQAQGADQHMADAKITPQQLQKANNPQFSAVITARDEVHANVATAPAQFNAQQQGILGQAHADAHGAVTTAQQHLHQAHTHAHGAAYTRQQEVMAHDAQERQNAANMVGQMFADLKGKVEAKLKALGDTVDTMFTDAEKSSRATFESEIDRRTTEYWLDHPFDALAGWVTEHDPEKERIWKEESANHMTRLDNALERIADKVESELKGTKELIAQGHAAIDEAVSHLDPKLRDAGKKAEQELGAEFDKLQQKVDAKVEELASHLADQYHKAQEAIDKRLQELKESEKGLLSAFEEKLAAVKKAIDEFKARLQGVVTDAEETLDLIISDPIAFLGHLLDALKAGFGQFLGNIGTHLKKGLIDWLTGGLTGLGITLPAEWDLKGVAMLVLQILDITWERVKAEITKLIGPRAMKFIEKAIQYAEAALNGGIEGLWEKIKADLSGLKDMIMSAIQSWLIETIIKEAIAKLVALSNPVGEIVEAVMDIYKVVMFFIEKANKILHLVETIVRSVSKIAHGQIGDAATWIENAMAETIPVIIGFLADMIGIGDAPEHVKKFIEDAREFVWGAIRKALAAIVEAVKGLFAGGDKDKPDERTDEQKKADLDSGVSEANQLLDNKELSDAQIKTQLSAIKTKYKMTSLDLVIDNETEDKETVHVHGAINPEADSPQHEKDHKEYKPETIKTKINNEDGSKVLAYSYKGASFEVTIDKKDMVTGISGTNLRLKRDAGIEDRGYTGSVGTHVPHMGMNRSHLIADEFMGSGYQKARNLITTSDKYNQVKMREQEVRIGDSIRDFQEEAGADVTFDLSVNVTWGSFIEDKIIQEIMADDPQQHPNVDEVKKTLQAFLELHQEECGLKLKRCMDVEYKWTIKSGSQSVSQSSSIGSADIWLGTGL